MSNSKANVTELWKGLQSTEKHESPFLNNCNSEILTVFAEADKWFDEERQVWAKERGKLTTQTYQLKTDLEISNKNLSIKNNEIIALKKSFADAEESKKQIRFDSERKLKALSEEVFDMKNELESMRKKHEKHNKEMKRDAGKYKSLIATNEKEIAELTKKLFQIKHGDKSLEEQCRKIEIENECFLSDKKTLMEKNQLLQTQINNYQTELEKCRSIIEQSELNYKNHLSQLEFQLNASRDSINKQDVEILRLKSSLDQVNNREISASNYQDQLGKDYLEAQKTIERLKLSKIDIESNLKKQQEKICNSDSELENMKKTVQELTMKLRDQNEYINNLKQNNDSRLSEEIQSLKQKLITQNTDLNNYKNRENDICQELHKARTLIDDQSIEVDRIRSSIKKQYEQNLETVKMDYEERLKSLDEKLSFTNDNLESRDKLNSKLTSQVQMLTTRLKDTENQLEINAKRFEDMNSGDSNLKVKTKTANDQDRLRDLKFSYEGTISSLEQQNHMMKNRINNLEDEIKQLSLRSRDADDLSVINSEMSKKLEMLKTQEVKHIDAIEKLADERIEHYKQRYSSNLKAHDAAINSLNTEIQMLKQKLDDKEFENRRLLSENSNLTKFVSKHDYEFNEVPIVFDRVSMKNTKNNSHNNTNDDQWQLTDDDDVSIIEEQAVENFMQEHRHRAKELEKKLDTHIDELKNSFDKY